MRCKVLISVLMLLLPIMVAGRVDCDVTVSGDLSAAVAVGQQTDTSGFAPLGAKLAEYYVAMEREPLHVQMQECDFLIETATDSAVRQFVAQDVYRHYIESPVMGAENIAVHVFDKWFASGLVQMNSQDEFHDARNYADFNRQSLIGKRAPGLTLYAPDGEQVTLFPSAGRAGKEAVLYFYDTDCAKCRLETMLLNTLFSSKDYPVEFYAVYVGDDRQAWQAYMAENLPGAVHLWDPALDSDFQRKYGVTQTPRMFLVDRDGVIAGRGLDTSALEFMLDRMFASKELTYGSQESESLFDGIFSMYAGRPSEAQVKGIADYVYDKTLSVRDTMMFKQLSGDYLYYLSTRTGEGFKEGLKYHIDKNIRSQSAIWTSQDDSLKVVGFAEIMYDLLSKAAVGSKVPGVKVPGELLTWRGSKSTSKRLDRLCGDENIIIFYTEGCEVCAAEKAAARALLARASEDSLSKDERKAARGLRVFMVNVDVLMKEDPSLATRLMDAFDLSSLPYIIKTDSKGVVLRRYLSLQ